MVQASVLLARLIVDPALARNLSVREWETAVGQAHSTGLLARLYASLKASAIHGAIPPAAMLHFDSAKNLARRQYEQALYEIGNVTEILRAEGIPNVLLKGAAYLALGTPAAEGRNLSDIDVMVPRTLIGEAEAALMRAGWIGTETEAYNQRYYRQWMHEIPPLRHVRRNTVVDLHHTILPPTARHRINPDRLFESARKVPGIPCLSVLCPVDMVIHSAIHLFHEGEFDRGLRDLSDLDRLIRDFSAREENFLISLQARAEELGVTRSVDYALRYANIFFGTPISAVEVPINSRKHGSVMDHLFLRALKPNHPSCDDTLTPLARFLLYIRSHWLRMPLHLLLPHLTRKFWMRSTANRQELQ